MSIHRAYNTVSKWKCWFIDFINRAMCWPASQEWIQACSTGYSASSCGNRLDANLGLNTMEIDYYYYFGNDHLCNYQLKHLIVVNSSTLFIHIYVCDDWQLQNKIMISSKEFTKHITKYICGHSTLQNTLHQITLQILYQLYIYICCLGVLGSWVFFQGLFPYVSNQFLHATVFTRYSFSFIKAHIFALSSAFWVPLPNPWHYERGLLGFNQLYHFSCNSLLLSLSDIRWLHFCCCSWRENNVYIWNSICSVGPVTGWFAKHIMSSTDMLIQMSQINVYFNR